MILLLDKIRYLLAPLFLYSYDDYLNISFVYSLELDCIYNAQNINILLLRMIVVL